MESPHWHSLLNYIYKTDLNFPCLSETYYVLDIEDIKKEVKNNKDKKNILSILFKSWAKIAKIYGINESDYAILRKCT